MQILAELSWMDLVIIILLAGGVFIGYTQGIIRYVLSSIVVLVSFVVAAQLKRPLFDALAFWTAFTNDVRELVIFLFLFVVFVIGGWFIVRAFYKRTRLPIPKVLDELGGAVLGLLFVALVITFHLVVLDSLFANTSREVNTAGAESLMGWYDAFNSSLIVQFFRDTLIPTAGYLARPFVPTEIARLLR
ncbi:MAG: CvpA family protein [Candidatus Limnocylindria bacterium]